MIGHIIAVAAVFEIHIETNIVTDINPKFSLQIHETVICKDGNKFTGAYLTSADYTPQWKLPSRLSYYADCKTR